MNYKFRKLKCTNCQNVCSPSELHCYRFTHNYGDDEEYRCSLCGNSEFEEGCECDCCGEFADEDQVLEIDFNTSDGEQFEGIVCYDCLAAMLWDSVPHWQRKENKN
jgi:hypothetical protein